MELTVPILQAVGREEHVEWVGRVVCELQHHPEILLGVRSWSQRDIWMHSKPNNSDLWCYSTWSPFFYHVSTCIYKQQHWDTTRKIYSHKKEIILYSVSDITLSQISQCLLFIYFGCTVFVAVCRLSLVVAVAGFIVDGFSKLQSTALGSCWLSSCGTQA